MSKSSLDIQWPRPASAESRLAFTWVRLFICIATIGVFLPLLLPATRRARPAAHRMQCSNNLKQIGLALLSYESTYRRLPPAYTVHWMSPRDADEAMFLASDENPNTAHTGGRTACFGDGSVRFLSSRVSPKILRGFITIDGGELDGLADY